MTISAELIKEIPVGNLLGEGIQWRAKDQSVWWTDILGEILYRLEWPSNSITRFNMPEPLASFAFCKGKDETLLAAFASGFAYFNLNTREIEWIYKPSFLPGEGRMNDGRVDRQGRFWCGTMMADPGGEVPASGRLFCLNEVHDLTAHEINIGISNGLCWSPDSKNLYFADSLLGEMYRYDFDAEEGVISNKTVFSKAPTGGAPDGAAVDKDGNIWSAHWGLGQVRVFDPAGDLIAEIETPASQPSCVAFGGKHLDLLFVTSAKEGMSDAILCDEPSAGHVFVFKTNTRGIEEMQYQGKNL